MYSIWTTLLIHPFPSIFWNSKNSIIPPPLFSKNHLIQIQFSFIEILIICTIAHSESIKISTNLVNSTSGLQSLFTSNNLQINSSCLISFFNQLVIRIKISPHFYFSPTVSVFTKNLTSPKSAVILLHKKQGNSFDAVPLFFFSSYVPSNLYKYPSPTALKMALSCTPEPFHQLDIPHLVASLYVLFV